jgi:hypothetical protein
MKSPNITAGRQQKVTAAWIHGVNSVRNPWSLQPDQFKWGVNLNCRGGIAQTRNGFGMKLSLPAGNFQGGIIFKSNKQYTAQSSQKNLSGVTINTANQIYTPQGTGYAGTELFYAVFCVDGKVYWSPFPLTQPKSWVPYQLTNISLDPNVDQVNFCVATQSAQTGNNASTTITPSHKLLIIQDGISQPAYWDGGDTTGGQSSVMPVGYWMAYSGNRLWVANGNIVSASDLANPLGWQERTQGSGRGDFSIEGNVTAMADYIGQNNETKLFVFTNKSTYTLSSGILNRSTWGTASNFQSVLFPNVGCVAGKSIAFQAGMMWWYSQGGLVSVDVAASSYLSSQVLYKDVEMAKAKRLMASDVSQICAISFENYLLYSIPYLEKLNSVTMVLDYAAASEWNTAKTPAWAGVWNGIRPINWSSDFIDNQPRVFAFSVDYSATNDGSFNHLWEAFLPQRYDSYLQINPDGSTEDYVSRIYCQMETALLGDEMDFKQIAYGDMDCSQIAGTVDVRVSYRGTKGAYQQILNTRILAVNDSYQYDSSPSNATISSLGFLQTQHRRLITENVQRTSGDISCESPYTLDVDKAFSFLIEWCGQFGLDSIRMYMDPWPDKSIGKPSSNETKNCVVGEDGNSITVSLNPAPQEIAKNQISSWSSTQSKTYTAPCTIGNGGISATATASYISYISQQDADQQAGSLALQNATNAANQYKAANPC